MTEPIAAGGAGAAGPMPVDVRLLGPVRLLVGGRRLELNGALTQAVLAVLALARGPLSADQLIERVWDEPPVNRSKSLHNKLSRIRALLRAAGVDDAVLLHSESQRIYQLNIGRAYCDYHRFTDLRAEADSARRRFDYEKASELYERALAEWSDEPLDGLRPSGFVDGQRIRMAEERRRTLYDRLDMEIECGRARQVLGELRAIAEARPTGTEEWVRYITALDADGQPAAAADACRVVMACFRDTGMDPPRKLRAIQEKVLRQERLFAEGAARWEEERPTLRESSSGIALATADGRTVVVTGSGITIGRATGNILRLTDPKVSRRHARVDLDGDLALIHDLDSANGVYVNDRRIDAPTPLAPGDVLRLGSVIVRVRPADPGA
ncbi:MAG TPA: BTAD domain-containing putative transcriptional regulator [Nocardia sp.]|nr:BTAD domain-containing putative transcriptional regulator [Nocardia sp.]HLS79287.1 BTAD domain-containing putative transcriptional regulator [Nocardia sp.]